MMQVFDKHRVSFVSVTQQFNTATSMGRLILNVLLSFAQFEREIIAERTRDKIAATRRKGKWAGGRPILGYDVDPNGFRLVVNADEAERLRAIFGLYLEHEGLVPVVQELDRRGWVNKCWQTRKGHQSGGKAFTKTSLHRLLTNVAYIGKVRYKDEVHEGEHPAIVDPGVFQRVQTLLQPQWPHRRSPGPQPVRGPAQGSAVLFALRLRHDSSPHHQKRHQRYRYYTCVSAQKRGWNQCPSKSIPAGQIEQFVVEQIKCIGRDEALLHEVLSQAREQAEAPVWPNWRRNSGAWKRIFSAGMARSVNSPASCAGDDNSPVIARLADLQERIGLVEGRVQKVREQIRALPQQLLERRGDAVGPVGL